MTHKQNDAHINRNTPSNSDVKAPDETVKEIADDLKTTAADAVSQAQETANEVVNQTEAAVADVAEKARMKAAEIAEEARQKAESTAAQRKSQAAAQIGGIANTLRHTGAELRSQNNETFAHYADMAAGEVEQVSDYLHTHDVGELVAEVGRFAGRQPELFIAGSLAAGFLLGRFLKSSNPSPHGSEMRRQPVMNPGAAYPRTMPSTPNQRSSGTENMYANAQTFRTSSRGDDS